MCFPVQELDERFKNQASPYFTGTKAAEFTLRFCGFQKFT